MLNDTDIPAVSNNKKATIRIKSSMGMAVPFYPFFLSLPCQRMGHEPRKFFDRFFES